MTLSTLTRARERIGQSQHWETTMPDEITSPLPSGRKYTGKPCGWINRTDAELATAEAGISAELKGPLSNTERTMLVMDRTDIRSARAALSRARGAE